MRSKQHETTGSGDLFRARLEQIINMKHEQVQLADAIISIPLVQKSRQASLVCGNTIGASAAWVE
jgi:hypothetical protein